ncbi:hypothetical protein KP509_15G071500 [Ceratopteris richardii]|uniref:Photosystem II 10 kDa polypeptide, chloroplastic n=1 Tax=Ceratopteris richardii TaxID=49495 RepID=A0A8T2T8F4_CERRI|nr:hypothetical protein KP509_15G071500 [Ceratopteris richardii]
MRMQRKEGNRRYIKNFSVPCVCHDPRISVYHFIKKYGANIDAYSPIFTPEVWSASKDLRVVHSRGAAHYDEAHMEALAMKIFDCVHDVTPLDGKETLRHCERHPWYLPVYSWAALLMVRSDGLENTE